MDPAYLPHWEYMFRNEAAAAAGAAGSGNGGGGSSLAPLAAAAGAVSQASQSTSPGAGQTTPVQSGSPGSPGSPFKLPHLGGLIKPSPPGIGKSYLIVYIIFELKNEHEQTNTGIIC